MEKHKRTLQSLAGLSVGDAFGERFFHVSSDLTVFRQLPDGQWAWTDDTHMALSIVDVLFSCGHIDEDALVRLFAKRYTGEPWRGYGGGARRLLALYARGADWRVEAPRLFDGGSYGNGGAMRAAPIGAYFAGDPAQAAVEAQRSASVTHAHLEGQAGAVAVAAATAIMSSSGSPAGTAFLHETASYVSPSATRDMIEEAAQIDAAEFHRAVSVLGTGQQVAAFDTVAFCLWVAAHHCRDFETALWTTVRGLGDRDTTCSIVGGMIAPVRTVPPVWLEHREPLPEGYSL